MTSRAELQRETMRLLEQANTRADRLGRTPDYFNLRSVEFLLLVLRLSALEGFPPRRLAEFGCGVGYGLRLWSQLVPEVVGIDLPSVIEGARQLIAELPPAGASISILPGAMETFDAEVGPFDLIVTQYVLEHVNDLPASLANLRRHVAEGGYAVHVLNNAVDRLSWRAEYRDRTPLYTQVQAALRAGGLKAALRYPFSYTPPHEPRFGEFQRELAEYRLEYWALALLKAGYEIVDYFPTRDVNWVIVTRPLA